MTQSDPSRAVDAGQRRAPTFGEGYYDYASGRWSWSPDMYAVLGLDDDGRSVEDLVFERMHPSDRAAVAESIRAAVATGGSLSGQYRIRGVDGRERAIAFVGDVERDADGRPVLGPDGGPVRIRGFAFDVSRAARLAAAEAVTAATADRAAIEQVKGALMFAYGLDADAAFGLLTRYSQRGNVKLALVARRAAQLLADQTDPGTEGSLLHVLERALGSVDPGLADAADAG